MKKNKIRFVSILLIAIAFMAFSSTFVYVRINENVSNASKVTVVTSCNPVYMATLNICNGIDGVEVVNLSQPTTGCLHDYSLTTGDMKLLAGADVFVINGGGMEGFLSDVMSAYPNLNIVEAVEGIELLGDENSHCWTSVRCYEKQVENIAKGLAATDEKNANSYLVNAEAYKSQLEDELVSLYDEGLAGQKVVIFHEAFAYLAKDLGFELVGCMDLDEERQVSASELHDMIELVQTSDVKYILVEPDYGKKTAEMVSEATGVKAVYLNPMIRGSFDKDNYIDIMKENLMKFTEEE